MPPDGNKLKIQRELEEWAQVSDLEIVQKIQVRNPP